MLLYPLYWVHYSNTQAIEEQIKHKSYFVGIQVNCIPQHQEATDFMYKLTSISTVLPVLCLVLKLGSVLFLMRRAKKTNLTNFWPSMFKCFNKTRFGCMPSCRCQLRCPDVFLKFDFWVTNTECRIRSLYVYFVSSQERPCRHWVA